MCFALNICNLRIGDFECRNYKTHVLSLSFSLVHMKCNVICVKIINISYWYFHVIWCHTFSATRNQFLITQHFEILKNEVIVNLVTGSKSWFINVLLYTRTDRTVTSLRLQLTSSKVRKMAELLEHSHSVYFTAFKKLFTEVVKGELMIKVCLVLRIFSTY